MATETTELVSDRKFWYGMGIWFYHIDYQIIKSQPIFKIHGFAVGPPVAPSLSPEPTCTSSFSNQSQSSSTSTSTPSLSIYSTVYFRNGSSPPFWLLSTNNSICITSEIIALHHISRRLQSNFPLRMLVPLWKRKTHNRNRCSHSVGVDSSQKPTSLAVKPLFIPTLSPLNDGGDLNTWAVLPAEARV